MTQNVFFDIGFIVIISMFLAFIARFLKQPLIPAYVILPHFLGGEHVSLIHEKLGSNVRKLLLNKISHIEELKKKHSLGHEHPQHD